MLLEKFDWNKLFSDEEGFKKINVYSLSSFIQEGQSFI